jgi:hypothetical protein
MKENKMKKWIVAILMGLAAFVSRADLLAGWSGDGDGTFNPGTTQAADSLSANIVSASLNENGQLVGVSRLSSFVYRNVSAAASATEAVNENSYVELTISAASGYQMNLSSLDLRFGDYGSSVGSANYFIRSSVDSYASDISSGLLFDGSPSETPLANIALSGYAGLTDITFRIYAWSADGSAYSTFIGFGNDTNTEALTDIGINGTVTAVPEPATIGMLGLGAVVSLLIRRLRG